MTSSLYELVIFVNPSIKECSWALKLIIGFLWGVISFICQWWIIMEVGLFIILSLSICFFVWGLTLNTDSSLLEWPALSLVACTLSLSVLPLLWSILDRSLISAARSLTHLPTLSPPLTIFNFLYQRPSKEAYDTNALPSFGCKLKRDFTPKITPAPAVWLVVERTSQCHKYLLYQVLVCR